VPPLKCARPPRGRCASPKIPTVSSSRRTARQAACQRTVTGTRRPPVFAGPIRPRRGILRLHTCHMNSTYLIKAKNPHTYAMAVTLTWWIWASWLIWGPIVHQINPIARIHPDISRLGTPRDARVSRRTGATAGGQTTGESADLARRIRVTRRIWDRIGYQIRRVGHFLHVIFEARYTTGLWCVWGYWCVREGSRGVFAWGRG
jgi:hypothetical protein